MEETVEISPDVLEILVNEAEYVVESIDDPEWHESKPGISVHNAIDKAKKVLEEKE